MTEAQCVKYPIKPGQRETLVNWVTRLKDRSAEVKAAQARAGFIAEAVFLERSDHGDYLLVYTSASNLSAVNEALSSAPTPLSREFDQLMAQTVDLEKAVALDFIYHTP